MTKAPLSPLTPPMAPFAPWPFYAEDEIEAVTRVLRSGKVNYWTGQDGRRFEEEYAEAAGCKYAVALANGTNALELALVALQIPPGSEVMTTPRTFIASASCIIMRGCIPILADVDLDSGNIAYKMMLKLGGAEAIGPILMGMGAPVNVLQRGSTLNEVVSMAAVTVVQAQDLEAATTASA